MMQSYFWQYVWPSLASLTVAVVVFAMSQTAVAYFRWADRRKKAKSTALYCATALQFFSLECDAAKSKAYAVVTENSEIGPFDPIPAFPSLSTFRDFHELTTDAQTAILKTEMSVFFSRSVFLNGNVQSVEARRVKLNEVATIANNAAGYLFKEYRLTPPTVIARMDMIVAGVAQQAVGR